MRLPSALLVLALSAGFLAGGSEPQIYRWKDKQGVEHVTNTPPPPGAVSLEVPPLENTKEPEKKAAPAPKVPRPLPAAARPLSADQERAWRALEQKLSEARSRGDVGALEAVVEGIHSEALWGNGVWALLLLPVAIFALVTLLGWWLGSGLRRPLTLSITFVFSLAGLALAQLCLAQFVYRAQALRLQTAVAALKTHLGTAQGPSPESVRRLDGQLASLEAATQPLAPPWRYPQEVRTLGEVLKQVVVNP